MGFTKRRFEEFPLVQQHRKCCDLLKVIYEGLLDGEPMEDQIDHYNGVQEWMAHSPLNKSSFEGVADRFHWHLSFANLSLREANLLPTVRQGDSLQASDAWPIAVYLDNLRSAHNVGSILRTVESFSLGEVYFSKETPSADHPQVKKTSMGTSEWVNTSSNKSHNELPKPLIALETCEGAFPLFSYPFPKSFTLVVGNEEYGCREETLKACESFVEIPMRGRKNSLNVANAFAMAAYEISRQRNAIDG